MSIIELLAISQTPGLWDHLRGLEGVDLSPATRISRGLSELERPDGPRAIYVEAACGTYAELVALVRAAMARNVAIFLGLQGANERYREEFETIGLSVTTARDAEMITGWVAQQLGLRRRASAAGLIPISFGGVKGGIGKSTVLGLTADALVERGVPVLVIDFDFTFSGIRRPYKIPPGAPSFLQILDDGDQFTPETLRKYIYKHPCGVHFLLGSASSANAAEDLDLPQADALLQAARMLDEYSVLLIDTGPDMKARPFSVRIAREGGWVILPAPAGCNESMGTASALEAFETQTEDLTGQCFLLYLEPQRGDVWTIQEFAPQLEARFPNTQILGQLPHDRRVITTAQKRTHLEGGYVSPLEVDPHSRLARTVHQMVDALCRQVGVTPPRPMPKSSLVDRIMQWMGWSRTPSLPSPEPLGAVVVATEEASS